MCIMEVHPTMPYVDMIQAIAHNLSTIDRDLEMLRTLPTSGETDMRIESLQTLQNQVHHAYAHALGDFTIEAAEVAIDHEGHVHHEIGAERTIEAVVKEATEAAQKDETR